jgi:hypothetical protein
MSELVSYTCSKEGCKISEDGPCLDGHEKVGECPNLIIAREPSPENIIQESGTIDLPSGEDLDFDQGTKITRARITRVIVLAGSVGSGKTTLLASIYEKFLRGPIANYLFAGSKTLIGFDKRCHLARIASLRARPSMERTKRGFDNKLLHLRVRPNDFSSDPLDMLFSDISGETFEMARDSNEECKQLGIIMRADHFAIVIDGEKLSSIDSRHGAFNDADLLLRRCIETGMLTGRSHVDVLFTKYDVITSINTEEIHDFISHIEHEMKLRYDSKLKRMHFFRVAALPKKPSVLPLFYGLDEMLKSWIERSPFEDSLKREDISDILPVTQYDKYIHKLLGSKS